LTREGDLRRGTVNFMGTQVLQFSSNALWPRLIGLLERLRRLSRRAPKTLRLCESLPLGERRFVAVVEFERTRFLLGGTSSSLVLLSRLGDAGSRAEDETLKENQEDEKGEEKC
jgi:flagellar biogenesis protein FliO